MQFDEAKFLASGAVRSSTMFRTTQAISDMIAAARGQRIAVDFATHRPVEVAPFIASEAQNLLISDLDPRDFKEILGQVPGIEFEKEMKNIVASGYLNAYKFAFWVNRWSTVRVELVRSFLPTFQIESPHYST